MNTLSGDLWFYAGAAGLAFSAGLWFYLFRRYRAASPAWPEPKEDLEQLAVAAQPVRAAPQAAATTVRLMPVEEPAKRTATPAVVYLQNLKIQMEHFEKEIHELRAQLDSSSQKHDSQFSAMLQRLGDLQAELHQQVRSQEQTEKNSTIERVPSLKEAAAKEAPLKLDLPVNDSEAKPSPSPAPQAAPVAQLREEEAPKPKRKGPVWPV